MALSMSPAFADSALAAGFNGPTRKSGAACAPLHSRNNRSWSPRSQRRVAVEPPRKQRSRFGTSNRGWRVRAAAEAGDISSGGSSGTDPLEPGDDYVPNDFAVSDEAVPDDILETLAAAAVTAPATVSATPAVVTPAYTPAPDPASPDPKADPEPEAVLSEAEWKRGDLKMALMDSLFGLERGARASSEARAEIAELVAQLEAHNPTPAPAEAADLIGGRWILVYTSFSELLPLLAASVLPLVKVGDIVQSVDPSAATLTNSITFIGPFASSTIQVQATFEVRSAKRLQVKFQEGTILAPQPGDLASASPLATLPESLDVFGQRIDLSPLISLSEPLKEAGTALGRALSGLPPLKFPIGTDRAQSWLLTTYLDDEVRVSRGDGGGLFVLVKEGSSLLS